MTNTSKKSIWIGLALIISLITVFLIGGRFFDNDGYFILASGEYIVENGIPHTNPFHFVDGLRIVIQQWLWAVGCYLAYSTLGKAGVYMIVLALYLMVLFVAYKICKLNQVNSCVAIIFSTLVLSVNTVFLTMRPTLITVLLLLLQIYVLEKYKRDKKAPLLLWLIPISLLEMNLHGSIWFMHFVFLLPYIVPPIKNPFVAFKKRDYKILPIILTMIPMGLVGFINPYGLDGILYIFQSYNDQLKSAGIQELQPLAIDSYKTIILLVVLFVALHFVFNKKKISAESFYLLCGTTVLAFTHSRNMIYFYVGVLCFFAELLPAIDFTKIKEFVYRHFKKFAIPVWILVVLLTVTDAFCLDIVLSNKVQDSENTPVKAVEYLNENADKDIRLYNGFNNGGYFEFNGYKVFMDPRPELYYESFNQKESVFEDWLAARKQYTKPEEFKSFLEKYDFGYLCVELDSTLNLYLQTDSDYQPVLTAEKYQLFQKIS